ncbi:hypothetical protein AgCh_012854 [Apium graveolens]
MSFHEYSQVADDLYGSNPFSGFKELTNPQVGYNWYQSHRSSDMTGMNLVDTSPLYSTAYSFPQHQVSNPGMYYSHEYEPPPTVTSESYASQFCAYQMFDTSSEKEYVLADENFDTSSIIASPYTLTCHTLSTGQLYYALESTSPLTTPCSTVASSIELISNLNNHVCGEEFKNINEVVNSVSILVKTDGYKEREDQSINKGMGGQDARDGLKGEIDITLEDVGKDDNIEMKEVKRGVEEIENDIDDGSSTYLTEPVSNSEKLKNSFDDSVVLDSLLVYQRSSSVTEYVEDFVHVKNRAEFIFKREFEDDLLSFCFVEGLKEELRDALEFWAPQTLQEAITLATFQQSLLEESVLAENEEMKLDKRLDDIEFPVETRSKTSVNGVAGEIRRDENLSTHAIVNDLWKQTTKNIIVVPGLNVIQIRNTTRVFTVVNNMHKWYATACKRNIHNFDPGGGLVPVYIFSFRDGLFQLVLKVHIISSSDADVGFSSDPLLQLQISVLKNSGTAIIPPGFTFHENAFYGCDKVMEVEVQQCVVHLVSLKEIGVVKDNHVAFRRSDFGVNHGLRSCDKLDEVSIIVELELACAYLVKTFKATSKCRNPKWYIKLINQTNLLERNNVGSMIISDPDAPSWIHILLGYFELESFNEKLFLVIAMHLSSKKFNEASFTSALSVNVYLSLLCSSKYIGCWVIVSEMTAYIASILFDSQIPSHIAYQEWIITDPPNLPQILVSKIKSNLESCTLKCPRKSACRLFSLRNVTPDFDNLAIYEHQHRASHSNKKWLLSILDGFVVLNSVGERSLFNTMDHKGINVLTCTQGEIVLNFFVSAIPLSCVTSDLFELLKKIVLLDVHDDKVRDNIAYDINISALESVNDLSRHVGRYNSNYENESPEEGRSASPRTEKVSGSEKCISNVCCKLKKENYLMALAWIGWFYKCGPDLWSDQIRGHNKPMRALDPVYRAKLGALLGLKRKFIDNEDSQSNMRARIPG